MQERNWQKSSYCPKGNSCVHVSGDATHIHVTESADPSGATLTADPSAFSAFIRTLKASAPHA